VLLEQCLGGNCIAWLHPVSWIALAAAVFFSTTNLYFISLGLQHYEAMNGHDLQQISTAISRYFKIFNKESQISMISASILEGYPP
jgi:deoxyxylulose-5-phosphate synthase